MSFRGILSIILSAVCLSLSSCNKPLDSNNNDEEIIFTVNFVTNCDTQIQKQFVKEGGFVTKPDNPDKTGYTFLYWEVDGNEWNFESDLVYKNLTFVAKWSNPIVYNIVYNLNGGENNILNKETYTVEDSFELLNPIKTGCSFSGWTDEQGNNIDSIQKGTIGNKILNANWVENFYTITIVNENERAGRIFHSSSEEPTTSYLVRYGTRFNLVARANDGYSFIGFYDGQNLLSRHDDYYITMPGVDITIYARWELNRYSIHYNYCDDDSAVRTYTVEDNVVLPVMASFYQNFVGWKTQFGEIIKEIHPGDYCCNLELKSVWETKQVNVIVDICNSNFSVSSGLATIDGLGLYNYYSTVTLSIEPSDGMIFKGWYTKERKLLSISFEYSFNIDEKFIRDYVESSFNNSNGYPYEEVRFIAMFWTIEEQENEDKSFVGGKPILSEDGKTVTYGIYPQTFVSDSETNDALNAMYPDNNQSDFGQYRRYGNNYYFHCGYIKKVNVRYYRDPWFRCDPIVWDVLENNDGNLLLFSNSILDETMYSSTSSNYKDSEIRNWLNNDFYNKAFMLGDSNINITNVDNSAESTLDSSNKNICENTNDKVFLLSLKELTTSSYGFPEATFSQFLGRTEIKIEENNILTRKPTDFSSTFDFWDYDKYFTRTPFRYDTKYVYAITSMGTLREYQCDNFYNDHIGVCPAIRITLNEI